MAIQQITIGKYLIEVIREKCIGAASCAAIAPKVFALDEQQLAFILETAAKDPDEAENILLAAQSCPTAAIVIKDMESGKQVWPMALLIDKPANPLRIKSRDQASLLPHSAKVKQ